MTDVREVTAIDDAAALEAAQGLATGRLAVGGAHPGSSRSIAITSRTSVTLAKGCH